MCENNHKVTFGFTQKEFDPGVHICQIFNDDDERHDALINFIYSGIKSSESTACFSDRETEKNICTEIDAKGINCSEAFNSGQLKLSEVDPVYFQNNEFSPEIMLGMLEKFYKTSVEENYVASRVIGEMAPKVQGVHGGDRLLEYESKVTMLQKQFPFSAVCQYDASKFDGSTILDILKVHPLMIVRGEIVHNPFYIQPEEYLASIS